MNAPDDGRDRTTAIVIANPTAGSYTNRVQQINEALDYLREHGWNVELKLTEGQGDARKLTREAVAQGLDVVVAVGGDGTINEIIQELAGSETALGVLPGGTVNVWARETGISLEIAQSRKVLVEGQTRRIDLGKVNDRYFLLMATIGFDAEVTRTVEQKPIKRFGVVGYILMGTWLGLGYPNFQAFLQIGKRVQRVRALQIVMGNTQLYAGAVKFTWRAKCDDGLLDVCIVHSQNILGRINVLVDFLFRRKQRRDQLSYESVREVKLHSNLPVAIQVDGDPYGHTARKGFPPTIFTIIPGALKVIVPREISSKLFSNE
jgi:diacylglycerol kinase (ATP)